MAIFDFCFCHNRFYRRGNHTGRVGSMISLNTTPPPPPPTKKTNPPTKASEPHRALTMRWRPPIETLVEPFAESSQGQKKSRVRVTSAGCISSFEYRNRWALKL